MKTTNLLVWLFTLASITMNAQLDFGGTPLPSRLGNASNWRLVENASDDFNYTFNPTSENRDFGPPGKPAKWNNFFHNGFEGPGATKWVRNHVSVSGGSLNVWGSRRFFNNNFSTPYTKSFEFDGENITRPETLAGCITSKQRVIYPVFVEARVKIMNSSLASDIWLLSPDDKEEIDIIEAYGGPGDDNRNDFFAQRIHLSHHVFIRPPNFKDYQPSDFNSWYRQSGITRWGDRTVRIGVNWKSPTILEYYINGDLVRVLDNDAIASKLIDGRWEYTYPAGVTSTGQNGQLNRNADGFQAMTRSGGIAGSFNQSRLNTAKNASNISVIDPFNYLQNGRKFSRQMDIIINVEDQSWQAAARRSPNNTEIRNFNNNNILVDWIRVYKPNNGSSGGSSGGETTCANAPQYNGNANSYSPGDRVLNNGVLYERTTGGWSRIQNCDSGGGQPVEITCANAPQYNGNANSYSPGDRVLNNGVLYERTTGGWSRIQNCDSGGGQPAEITCANAPQYNGNANSYSPGDRVLNNGVLYERTTGGWSRIQNCDSGGGQPAEITCANAPQYNGNANSYSPGDRVLNNGVLYERTAGGWNLVQSCNGSKELTSLSTEEIGIKIYPNPASSNEDVTIINASGDITISDITGRIVTSILAVNGRTTLNTSLLTTGVYFVTTNSETQKLIIK